MGAAHGLGKGQGRRQTTSSTSRGYGATRTPGEHGTQNVASLSDTDPRPGESLAVRPGGQGPAQTPLGPTPGSSRPRPGARSRKARGGPGCTGPPAGSPTTGTSTTQTRSVTHTCYHKRRQETAATLLYVLHATPGRRAGGADYSSWLGVQRPGAGRSSHHSCSGLIEPVGVVAGVGVSRELGGLCGGGRLGDDGRVRGL